MDSADEERTNKAKGHFTIAIFYDDLIDSADEERTDKSERAFYYSYFFKPG